MRHGANRNHESQARYHGHYAHRQVDRQARHHRRRPQQAAATVAAQNMNRRGVTVAELLVALVVMAFLGIALTRILINDSRFVSKQDAMLAARQAARSAMNTVAAELRMVGDSGITAATPKQVSVRIPYAFGVLCQTSGADRIAVVLPTDSVAYASAVPGGVAWRDDTGIYRLVNGVTVSTSANTGACVGDSIRVAIPGSQLIAFSP